MNSLEAFLHVYFYQIETILNNSDTGLKDVEFHSEEANPDEYLKKFMKKFMSEHNKINKIFNYNLRLSKAGKCFSFGFSDIDCYCIEQVLLPTDLTENHRLEILKQKKSIYTNPDLYLKISNGNDYQYVSVELKSTKNDKIPGSSVQQIAPYEWVIFVQHKNNNIKVVTGMYINSITERLPFPDRSPRPEVGFNVLFKWNSINRCIKDNTLIFSYPDNTILKEDILENWHSFLVKEWLHTVKATRKNINEKWFNHTIRLYTKELINYYESISEVEKNTFKQLLQENINKAESQESNKV